MPTDYPLSIKGKFEFAFLNMHNDILLTSSPSIFIAASICLDHNYMYHYQRTLRFVVIAWFCARNLYCSLEVKMPTIVGILTFINI